jgi:hypothetical protein
VKLMNGSMDGPKLQLNLFSTRSMILFKIMKIPLGRVFKGVFE